jgi:putative redox protein
VRPATLGAMSVTIASVYHGTLRCSATHGPSKTEVLTDAPVDNMGRGESFSPTDLVATALLTCMLTTMAIVADRDGVSIDGAEGTVEKHMVADPHRRIARLPATLRIPAGVPEEARPRLEAAARGCPVMRSLDPRIEKDVTIVWG